MRKGVAKYWRVPRTAGWEGDIQWKVYLWALSWRLKYPKTEGKMAKVVKIWIR